MLSVCLADELGDLGEVVVALKGEGADAVEVALVFLFLLLLFVSFVAAPPSPSPPLYRGSEQVQEDRRVLAAVEGEGDAGGPVFFCVCDFDEVEEVPNSEKKGVDGHHFVDGGRPKLFFFFSLPPSLPVKVQRTVEQAHGRLNLLREKAAVDGGERAVLEAREDVGHVLRFYFLRSIRECGEIRNRRRRMREKKSETRRSSLCQLLPLVFVLRAFASFGPACCGSTRCAKRSLLSP